MSQAFGWFAHMASKLSACVSPSKTSMETAPLALHRTYLAQVRLWRMNKDSSRGRARFWERTPLGCDSSASHRRDL